MASPRSHSQAHQKATPPRGARDIGRLADDPYAPEFFVSGCSGFSIGFGNVMLTFEAARFDHSGPETKMNRVVVTRLVLPIPAAQRFVLDLNQSLDSNGLSPSRAVTTGMMAQ